MRSAVTTTRQLAGDPNQLLLIEHDAQAAEHLVRTLTEAWPRLQISCVAGLLQAEAGLGPDVDCVLLDIDLPGALGIDAVHRIRSLYPDLPIVVLTAEGDEDSSGEALTAGAQDYLSKSGTDGSAMARAIRHSVQRNRAERYARELALLRFQSAESARVQRGLMPRMLIEDPRVWVRSGYRPGDRRQVLGGDFFDVVQSSPSRLKLVLGDVCGHGPDEAALGVQIRIAWRTLILAGVQQLQLLETLDRLTNQERHADHVYATVASIEIDLNTGRAWVGLAGHPPPLVSKGGTVQLLTEHVGGPPLGIGLPPRWELHEVELGERWTLLLYSDGIYEGKVVSRGTRLGIEGLLELLAADSPEAVWDSVPNRILDQVEALNDGPLEDDVALLAVRCDPLTE
ncbi:MAG TPA: SpoIIE family protein phosphatase [Solirubrobacteraceae bacterium]|jgi:serine phosphatase RsbU (regulator of sigma subunit)|nr:SpoIIE family protein phosphatase [Solirubrobacteraceae bacterium]